MATLKQLIDQYCPDGVEYQNVGTVFQVSNGKGINRSEYQEHGLYPIVDQGRTFISAWTDASTKLLTEPPYIVFGDHSRERKWIPFNFVPGADGTKLLKASQDDDNLKYLFHALSDLEIPSRGYNRHWSIVRELAIPLPPREVQDKIVEYLDTFAALCENLDTDIAQRERQIAAYREKLLSDDYLTAQTCTEGMMKYERLGDVAPYSGSRIASDLLNNSNFVGVDNLLKEMKGKVNSEYGPNTKTVTSFTQGDVLVGNIRPYLRKIWFADVDGGCSGDVLAFHPAGISPRFLYHVLCSERFWSFNVQSSKGAKMPRGDKRVLPEFSIPLPPREVQDKIVAQLDAMQELIDNLRLERELRQQQFDYYRERLLSFPKKNTAEV
ncbi:restriction endonuclease subunit S [Corynebacterium macclintockiae]|uniref:restriction endonuclease subunit S n=1 Tax=Corynebacterium macclintockiae TaxID=2913501 RepID=UPI003EBBA948